jgi:NADPH-dependent methylglyoxal reductase
LSTLYSAENLSDQPSSTMTFNATDIVLISGANGHVAQHIVFKLLNDLSGPRVRVSVRSESSATQLSSVFQNSVTSARLEIIRVPDITISGAFDEAMKGVSHVAHVASPLPSSLKDTENDLLIPAIRGTIGILESALKEQHTVRSVVITGSFAAVFDPSHDFRPGYTYSSKDWNPTTYAEAADPNLDLTRWKLRWRSFIPYMASKTLAERAAWEFYDKQKPKWSLNVILPVYIGGPCILPLTKGAESLSFSNQLIWNSVSGKQLPEPDFPFWVDVRDLAIAHVTVLRKAGEVEGKRFLLASGAALYSDFAEIARKSFEGELKPSSEKQRIEHYGIATSGKELCGIGEFIGVEEMVRNTVRQVLDAGKE